MHDHSLLWFRDDLRLHDNPVLHRALSESRSVLPVYCIDPRWFETLDLGFRKAGHLRARFLLECLADLRQNLRPIGGDLLVRIGRPAEIIPDLVKEYEITAVYAQRLITAEETAEAEQVQRSVAPYGCRFEREWGHLLYHPEEVSFEPEKTPATFKTFRKYLRKSGRVRAEYPTPEKINLPSQAGFPDLPTLSDLGFSNDEIASTPAYSGGETAALERLQYYLFDTQLLTRYKWTRNQSLGSDYSSKLSPYLARGCLSPRRIYHAVKKYEREIKKNVSTYWLIFELKWREFFHYLAMKHGNRMFFPGGIKQRKQEWREDPELFRRWREGRTGVPFVDAHMRELNQTGFMSNRGRVNNASFLSRDYQLNWTWGAAWFESRLIDYDVSSNWLNWNMQATELRYTNPLWQNRKYDPKGAYIKHWLPELKTVPPPFCYAPFLMDETEQKEYGLVIGEAYPGPVAIRDQWDWALKRLRNEAEKSGGV